jgi:tetratricopeptide (TPR) repeat protein
MELPEAALPAPVTLDGVELDAHVIEDFRPLCESIERQLAAAYWERTGVLPFIDNSVPYLINNNGAPSERAAAVLLAACLESKDEESPVTVLEVGAGSALFARYFLDAFRTLCAEQRLPHYERLTYVVTDRARRTVEQWAERDLFAEHPGRVLLATCDACRPETLVGLDDHPLAIPAPMFIVCNYVLDVLPAAVVRTGENGPEQLCVRTHLTTNAAVIAQYAPVKVESLRELASSADPVAREQLLSLLTVLEFETSWRPTEDAAPSHLAEALDVGRGLERILLNHGALDAVDRWLARLAPDGCLLVRDYGPVERGEMTPHASPQRFGASTAVGLNFPLLEHHLGAQGWSVLAPQADAKRSIHVRLVRRAGGPRVASAFMESFGPAAEEFSEQPFAAAIEHARAGRNEDALQCFKTAVDRNPRNWFVVGSAAEFVSLQLRDFRSGAELARAAIELNPYYSAWLWNVLGDSVYCSERFDDAHEAYLQAARIDPDDPRTNLNLAYTFLQRGEVGLALHAIARGLARDGDATYRERLLEKQQQILATLSARTRAEHERLVKRIWAFA